MRFFRFTLSLLVFLLVSFISFSQAPKPTTGSVSGKLVDSRNSAVSYATVTLLRMDSSVVNGDLTKDDGSFTIAPTGIGNFILRVEAMGTATKFVSVTLTESAPDKNVGSIKLAQTENSLKEVSVVGEKPIMELKVDKKVFNVEKNTTTAGGSATDVLQNVPAVSVDADGNVSLRGKTGVTILIDGKPATMLGADVASALQSLPAGSIESVEVLTNPSAKYDAAGTSGIINIITRKNSRFGMNGNVTVGAGTRDKYNGNLGLNARKGKWNVFLNSSWRQNKTYNNVTTTRVDTGNFNQANSYRTYEHVPRNFGGFFNTIGATFDPDKYNSITLTENINSMGFAYRDKSDYYVYSTPFENPADSIFHQNRYTDFAVKLFSVSSSLDYKHKFKKKDEELSVDATYATTTFTRNQDYVTRIYPNTAANPTVQHSKATGGNSSFNVWADYTDPLFTKNGKLGAGFKSQLFWFNSRNTPTIVSATTDIKEDTSQLISFDYSTQIHAAYINWSDQVGKIGYQAGVRVEDAIYFGNGLIPIDKTVRDTVFKNSFLNVFPSAFVSYQLKNQQSIYLNYSARTNRPGFMQMLPYLDLSNPGTINKGNPDLIPEFIHNIEFSYNKATKRGDNFIVSAYYAYTQNLIEKITRPVTPGESVAYNVDTTSLFSQPINIKSGTTYGLEGTGHVQLLPIWDATINLNFFQNNLIIGNKPGLTLQNNSGFTWFGKINTSIKLPKNFSFQLNANYESPKIVAQGNLQQSYWIDLALRKNFWKNKATLVINCSDVFKTRVFVNNYYMTTFDQTTNRVKETRIGNITFTYRFGKSDAGKQGAGGGKRAGKGDGTKKIEKPVEGDREKNLKESDDNDQGGGGQGGPGGRRQGQ